MRHEILFPVRASPVPSVVRGSFVVKFFSRSSARALVLSLFRTHVCTAIEAAFPTTCSSLVHSSPLLRAPLSFFRVWSP